MSGANVLVKEINRTSHACMTAEKRKSIVEVVSANENFICIR